jgi:hypothetical protein
MEMDMARSSRGPMVQSQGKRSSTVADRVPEEIRRKLEEMRRG